MGERIWSEAELMQEKPKGELLLRNDAGVLRRLFSCHGCQSCWEYDDDTDTVSQAYPHFISFEEIKQ